MRSDWATMRLSPSMTASITLLPACVGPAACRWVLA